MTKETPIFSSFVYVFSMFLLLRFSEAEEKHRRRGR